MVAHVMNRGRTNERTNELLGSGQLAAVLYPQYSIRRCVGRIVTAG